jgi:hypothetical protein
VNTKGEKRYRCNIQNPNLYIYVFVQQSSSPPDREKERDALERRNGEFGQKPSG